MGRGMATETRYDQAMNRDDDRHPCPIGGRSLPYALGAALCLLALGGAPSRAQFIPPSESGFSLPSVPVGTLRRATQCETDLPTFGHPDLQYWPPHGTMTMSNDGGWCWLQFGQSFRAALIHPEASVAEPPRHGDLDLTRMSDRISMAYRPAPGFIGTDSFAVRTDGPLPHTIPVTVTVR
jgi:hypothetical protein